MKKWNRTIKLVSKILVLIAKWLVKLGLSLEEIELEIKYSLKGE